mmetsp:Transcript_44411/g.105208  ORF Transcript_44411/g.105208 Transcript_44411/m.105208 type:complete len:625 (+) Transcript_44411:51-1925(+)
MAAVATDDADGDDIGTSGAAIVAAAPFPWRPNSLDGTDVVTRHSEELAAFLGFTSLSGNLGQAAKDASPTQGVYLANIAVSIGAVFLAIELLIEFAEVVLPFIFAVLLMLILEPLKKCLVRVMTRIFIMFVTAFCMRRLCLVEAKGSHGGEQSSARNKRPEPRQQDDDSETPSLSSSHAETQALQRRRLQGDGGGGDYSPVEVSPRRRVTWGDDEEPSADEESTEPSAVPIPGIQKLILTSAIIFCMIFIGRVLWLVVKAFIKAGEVVLGDIRFYWHGANRLKGWFQLYVHSLHAEIIDWGPLVDDLVHNVRLFAEESTSLISDLLFQAVVTFIFLLYLLWSPIKIEKNTMTQEVFKKAGRFLTVKTLTSVLVGLSVTLSLWLVQMPIPAAFGLLAFLLNFLPGVGSVAATILPCGLGLLDARVSPGQVILAFIVQVVLHLFFDYFIEPIFFGMSAEVHSVVVILGIAFFGQIWGVPGMLISVPLMAVARLILRSSKLSAASSRWASDVAAQGDEEQDGTIAMLDTILEGRWMSSVGGAEHISGMSMAIDPTSSLSVHGMNRRPSAHPEGGMMMRPWNSIEPSPPRSVWDTAAGRMLSGCYENHSLLIEVVILTFMVWLVFFLL